MQYNYKVQGGEKAAQPVVVNHDNVYIHSNIHKIEIPEFPESDLYEYDEIVMTKDEYIQYTQEYISDLEMAIAETAMIMEEHNSDLELAVAELGMLLTEGE